MKKNVSPRKIYFTSRAEAIKVRDERNARMGTQYYGVFRMPKGSRNVGKYAVCTDIMYLNLP